MNTAFLMKFSTLVLLSFALNLACASGPRARPDDRTSTSSTSSSHDASPPDCGPTIDGSRAIAHEARLIMFGEIHGTYETPEFVISFVCQVVTSGQQLRLGLELPAAEAAAIARFLESDGQATDRAALLAGAHWRRDEQDGRSSEAILTLLDDARRLRAAGLPLEVFVFDVDAWADWNERDSSMAARILEEADTHPEAMIVTLSGNLHNRTVPGLPWDPEAQPMGTWIRAERPEALSFDLRHHGGTAWICMKEGCGSVDLSGSIGGPSWAVELWPSPDEHGYGGVFWIGSITAAPPAIGAAESGPHVGLIQI